MFSASYRQYLPYAVLVISLFFWASSAWGVPKSLEPPIVVPGWNVSAAPLPESVVAGTSLRRVVHVRTAAGVPPSPSLLARLRILLDIEGQTTPLMRQGDYFEFIWQVPEQPGEITASLVVEDNQGRRSGPKTRVRILPDIRVMLPPVTKFPQIPAGCAPTAFCQPLDLSGSQNLSPGVALSIRRVKNLPGQHLQRWGELKVAVRQEGQPDTALWRGPWRVVRFYDPARPIEICVASPNCRRVPTSPGPALESILVSPAATPYARDTRHGKHTTLEAAILPTPWWICYLSLLLILSGVLVAIIVALGYKLPHDFPRHAILMTANQERQLHREPGRPLYGVPHGRRGFYRSASCCFTPEGLTVLRRRAHVLRLEARGGHIISLKPHGCELYRKERNRWHPIRTTTSNHMDMLVETELMPGETYQVKAGSTFYFRVEM